jgi:carbon monoxide dehydrogenase subunit G
VPDFRHTIEVRATPEQVWDVLGDLSAVERWIPGVTSVTVDGMTRTCTFDDGHTQHEEISDYSPATRSYRYLIEGAPLPVTDNCGAFTVHPAGQGAVVIWESSFTPLDPAQSEQLAGMWEPFLPMVLQNLKSTVEQST